MNLLDTNVISELSRDRPDQSVIGWFDDLDTDTIVTSAIVIAEIRYGIESLPEGRRRSVLDKALTKVRMGILKDRILPFDEDTAIVYATLAVRLRSAGVVIDQNDMMIAATALQHGATVATRNVKHFQPCGVSVANPFEAP